MVLVKSEGKAVPTELRTDGVKWRSLVKREGKGWDRPRGEFA